uniref:Uncharacterized protein n=1 Tax=Bubo bubo TaxID=30461 RepID=A0A8C0IFB7_BUBBB
ASHHVVSKMLRHLEDSVKMDEPPNPSVLLAMNLAGATGSITHKQLLQEIEKEAVKRAQKDMTSGEVALYVLALISSCENPRHVQALGQSIDLLRILQEKTDEEVASLEVEGIPKTTLYSVSLDALSLCLTKAGGYQGASVILAKRVLSPDNTRAVAALAMACAHSHTDLHDVRELLWEALSTVTNGFLDEQEKGHGMIGNIYSTGLALQALQATGKFYAPRESCLPSWADPTWKPLAWTALPKPVCTQACSCPCPQIRVQPGFAKVQLPPPGAPPAPVGMMPRGSVPGTHPTSLLSQHPPSRCTTPSSTSCRESTSATPPQCGSRAAPRCSRCCRQRRRRNPKPLGENQRG